VRHRRHHHPTFTEVYGDERPSGWATGGWVISIHRSRETCVCGCCAELIKPGDQVAEISVYGEDVTVCMPCAGTP
jgi:hypothetical protein